LSTREAEAYDRRNVVARESSWLQLNDAVNDGVIVLTQERVSSSRHTLLLRLADVTGFTELATEAHRRSHIDVEQDYKADADAADTWTQIRLAIRTSRPRRQSEGPADGDLRICGSWQCESYTHHERCRNKTEPSIVNANGHEWFGVQLDLSEIAVTRT
jgi:hypothetical protein